MLFRYLFSQGRAGILLWDPVPFFVALSLAELSVDLVLDNTIHPTTEFQRTVSAHTATLLDWRHVVPAILICLAVWVWFGPHSFLLREIVFPGLCGIVAGGKTWLTTGTDGLALFITLTIGYLAFIDWVPLIIRSAIFLRRPVSWLVWRLLTLIIPILAVLGFITAMLTTNTPPTAP